MTKKTSRKNGAATAAIAREHGSDHSTHRLSQRFAVLAQKTAIYTGHPSAFMLGVGVIVGWVVTGPIFNYSDTWQLVINTGTTIVTFLMVFLIQNTQNRDMLAMQIKLSELVLTMKGAEDKFATIEDLTDDELEQLHADCRARVELTADKLSKRGKPPTAHPSNTTQRNRSAKVR